jgi:hypothetical protein
MGKPNLLINPGQSYYAKHTLLNNNHLTPDYSGPFGPAKEGQSHWFSINRMGSTPTDLQYNTRPLHVDSGCL